MLHLALNGSKSINIKIKRKWAQVGPNANNTQCYKAFITLANDHSWNNNWFNFHLQTIPDRPWTCRIGRRPPDAEIHESQVNVRVRGRSGSGLEPCSASFVGEPAAAALAFKRSRLLASVYNSSGRTNLLSIAFSEEHLLLLLLLLMLLLLLLMLLLLYFWCSKMTIVQRVLYTLYRCTTVLVELLFVLGDKCCCCCYCYCCCCCYCYCCCCCYCFLMLMLLPRLL